MSDDKPMLEQVQELQEIVDSNHFYWNEAG